MTSSRTDGVSATAAAGALVLPLALAQFICSFAGSNMNVAISTIADDLDTSVTGIQTTITLFTLTMAALMIPGSKLTDIWGRKVCFIAGLGAAAGPLIGGLITSYVSWRASFLLQVLVVAAVALLARRLVDPPLPDQRPSFDVLGAVLSALGLFFVVFGILLTGT